ncbi:MAG: hypothetical protein KC502_03540 [Myxococcales bacterium]|nr:hypothetical protein [Myxococcales bacterium]
MPTLVVAGSPVKKLVFSDPAGDDFGPGSYTYPTHAVYAPGSFDLRNVEITDKGATIQFKVKLGARIKDPWNSKDWDGNGFSLQFVQIYIDTDHKAGSGFTKPLPGLGGAKFAADEAWDKLVLISPQGKTRLGQEVKYKARAMRKSVVIPRKTRARGKTLTAIVKKSDLGPIGANWGIQVVVQSNEGYPAKKDILTRRVNQVRGEHRFGGGHDTACDPHVIDILAGKAKGEKTEIAAQKRTLAYTCNKKLATLPMIYASKR